MKRVNISRIIKAPFRGISFGKLVRNPLTFDQQRCRWHTALVDAAIERTWSEYYMWVLSIILSIIGTLVSTSSYGVLKERQDGVDDLIKHSFHLLVTTFAARWYRHQRRVPLLPIGILQTGSGKVSTGNADVGAVQTRLACSMVGTFDRMWGSMDFPPNAHASRSRPLSPATAFESVSSSSSSSPIDQSSSSSSSTIMRRICGTSQQPQHITYNHVIRCHSLEMAYPGQAGISSRTCEPWQARSPQDRQQAQASSVATCPALQRCQAPATKRYYYVSTSVPSNQEHCDGAQGCTFMQDATRRSTWGRTNFGTASTRSIRLLSSESSSCAIILSSTI